MDKFSGTGDGQYSRYEKENYIGFKVTMVLIIIVGVASGVIIYLNI